LPFYHHNVAPIQAPSGEFLIFSIGMFPEPGTNGVRIENCSRADGEHGATGGIAAAAVARHGSSGVLGHGTETVECWWANSVDGPWQPVMNPQDKATNGRNLFSSTNPSPVFDPSGNGTLYVFGHTNPTTGLTVSMSDDWKNGSSYTPQMMLMPWLTPSNQDYVGEDPTVWFDDDIENAEGGKGAWRCLFHTYNRSAKHQFRVGGYAQSSGRSVFSTWTPQIWSSPAYTTEFTTYVPASLSRATR
jgi:hypothetical protein